MMFLSYRIRVLMNVCRTGSPLAVGFAFVVVPVGSSLAGGSGPPGGRTPKCLCQEDPV